MIKQVQTQLVSSNARNLNQRHLTPKSMLLNARLECFSLDVKEHLLLPKILPKDQVLSGEEGKVHSQLLYLKHLEEWRVWVQADHRVPVSSCRLPGPFSPKMSAPDI